LKYGTNGNKVDEDANTVATTAIEAMGSVYSGKSSYLSQKYNQISEKLNQQKLARQNLEEKVKKMKEELENNAHLIKMQETNDHAIKLMNIDRVCQMQSGQNYTTHMV
jgi:benzoyl-CoA reductase/2-hydroxyglutaryl-CoA dehydratase subunit BcrC/BadD/HgdB